jgi:dienelactone hydrolase
MSQPKIRPGLWFRGPWAALFGGLLLAACGAGAPAGRQAIALDSRTLGFIDQVAAPTAGAPQRVSASLMLPEDAAPGARLPAMVLLHGGTGQGAQDWYYARLLNGWGIAVLAVDSFGPRGVRETIFDQSAVSEASIMADAYAALNQLSKDPRIDPQRIGVMGFSKGAAPALLAALDRFRVRLADPGNRFALHVAFYPWCGFSFLDQTATGAPVLVLSGARDRVTPAALCIELAGRLRSANPRLPLDIAVYPAGGHAFDYPHPFFRTIESLPVRGNLPVHCFFAEEAPNRFVERWSRQPVVVATLRNTLERCSDRDPEARAIYDASGTRDALARIEALARAILLGPPPPAATLGGSR